MVTMTAMLAAALAAQVAPAGQAPASGAAPACPAGAEVAAPYAGWEAMQGVAAGTTLASPATLAIGRSARATLVPAAAVKYPVPLTRPPESGATGGLFAFDVTTAGSYRVALGAGAWIDVVAGGKALTSVAHGHGPDCPGIRKYVDYRLTPGRYLLQVSGTKGPTLALMVAKLG